MCAVFLLALFLYQYISKLSCSVTRWKIWLKFNRQFEWIIRNIYKRSRSTFLSMKWFCLDKKNRKKKYYYNSKTIKRTTHLHFQYMITWNTFNYWSSTISRFYSNEFSICLFGFSSCNSILCERKIFIFVCLNLSRTSIPLQGQLPILIFCFHF